MQCLVDLHQTSITRSSLDGFRFR